MIVEGETTLGAIAQGGNVHAEAIPVLIGQQFGYPTLNATLPLLKFHDLSEIANSHRIAERGEDPETVSNRPLNKDHATGLARYMLKGLVAAVQLKLKSEGDTSLDSAIATILLELGEQPYQALQAATVNIRTCDPRGTDLRIFRNKDGSNVLYLSSAQILWVVDAQHRREGMGIFYNNFLKPVTSTGKYVKKGLYVPVSGEMSLSAADKRIWGLALEVARANCTIDVTIHLGLTGIQERQLFHDLNNLAKTVEKSIANAFDTGNPVNLFVRKVLEGESVVEAKILDKDTVQAWNANDGSVSRKDIVLASSLLFAGQTDPKKVPHAAVVQRYDLGRRFWRAVSASPHFGEPGANEKTVLAQAVMVKALAQLVYTFDDSREANPQHLEIFLGALEAGQIDFSHTNPMWRIFEEPAAQRDQLCPGISDAITPEAAGFNLTAGNWDAGKQVMRFSANSRDVWRYLGDVIRWKLGLPKRPALVKVQQQARLGLAAAA